MSERSTATLLINAPDRKGLVHAISSFYCNTTATFCTPTNTKMPPNNCS